MALDLTALPDYVNQNSTEFLTKAVTGNDTVEYLNDKGSLRVGVKFKEAVQILDSDVNLQSNADCGRNPQGDTRFEQITLEVHPLADFKNYCPKAFEKKWMSQYLTKGQDYSDGLLFTEEIMNERAGKIALANEKLIWQGDTDSLDTNLAHFDGVIKQLTTAGVTPVTLSGADVVAQLQSLVASIDPDAVNAGDVAIFIGKDKAMEYAIALANKNLFKEGDAMKVLGTNVDIVGVAGLTGTGQAVAGRASHLIVGTDLTSDTDIASLDYSVETKQFYMDFQYTLGVTVAYPDDFVIGTFA